MLYLKLTPKEVKEKFERGEKFRLIDVREKGELEICSVHFAEHFPMSDIQNRIEEFDRNEELIFMCHHGVRSCNVAFMFSSMGFTKISNMSGGINRWADTIDEAMKKY
jgi:adenylyltransferase/sulfurtransferase